MSDYRPPLSPIAARLTPSGRPMGIGMIMPISEMSAYGGTEPPRFADMLEMTRLADEIGFDAVWIPDHLIVKLAAEGNVIRGVWEGWTTIAALAAATRRITLGIFVTCTAFRNPALVAKMAENLDEISAGRFVLGLGAGWHEPEFEMFGYHFDHRVDRFEEALQIICPLVREGTADFQGIYYQVRNAVNRPRGPQAASGGIPILLGAQKPRMMRLTARYADAWNSDWQSDPRAMAGMMAALDRACDEVGRDPATLVKTGSANIAMPGSLDRRPNPIRGDTDDLARAIRAFRDLGLRHFVCGFDPCTPRSLEQFAPVLAALDRG